MKRYVIFVLLLINTFLLTIKFNYKKENIKEINKVEEILSKPNGIQAYTLNGEKTNLSYNDLINSYVVDTITCKNGTIATFNKTDNSVNLSNIHMPDYCTMDFKEKPTIYSQILKDNPTISTRTDFSTTFTTTNTGTLYKSTESIAGSTAKDVYYFAGDAKNNWVKFGKFSTTVVRGFGSSQVNGEFKDYDTMEECKNGTYLLVSKDYDYNHDCTYVQQEGSPIYWRIIRTNHDGSVRLLYSGISPDTTSGYIGTSAFNVEMNDPMNVGYMYGTSGTLASNRTNTSNSAIKEVIDTWYSNNLSSYTKYISVEAVYCCDRNAINYSISSKFDYYALTRLSAGNPTFDCENSKDAFSGDNSDAKLIYPIGLMTADEVVYAGGKYRTNFSNSYAWYYLNSAGSSITGSTYWWLLSPYFWDGTYANSFIMLGSDNPGNLNTGNVTYSSGVRPVISIKSDALWYKGNGSSEEPYEIVYD